VSMLLLVQFLNHPFHDGIGGLRPDAMERTLQVIDQELSTTPQLPPPCDTSGNPLAPTRDRACPYTQPDSGPKDSPVGKRAAHLRSEAGRARRRAMIQPKGMTARSRYAVSNARDTFRPAVLESEEGFEPTTSRLRLEEPSSSRCCPAMFSLLRSAGSSVECIPGLWRYGRGND
jgi:hypothetical protein